jgi:hypothetical protein
MDFVSSNIDIRGMQGSNDILLSLKLFDKFIEFLGQMKWMIYIFYLQTTNPKNGYDYQFLCDSQDYFNN